MAISPEQIARGTKLVAMAVELWADETASKRLADRRVIGEGRDVRDFELVIAGATVLWVQNSELVNYRPGRWESFLEVEHRNLLLDKARSGDSSAVDKLSEADREKLMWGPVDDASIFPEFGGGA
jgi:hypothetical protein